MLRNNQIMISYTGTVLVGVADKKDFDLIPGTEFDVQVMAGTNRVLAKKIEGDGATVIFQYFCEEKNNE